MFKDICIFHKYELKDIVYEEYTSKDNSYGTKTIEIYKCNRCNKIKYKTVNKHLTMFQDFQKNHIKRLEEKGIEDIIKYKFTKIINNN